VGFVDGKTHQFVTGSHFIVFDGQQVSIEERPSGGLGKRPGPTTQLGSLHEPTTVAPQSHPVSKFVRVAVVERGDSVVFADFAKVKVNANLDAGLRVWAGLFLFGSDGT
jgi:hypothetical protein